MSGAFSFPALDRPKNPFSGALNVKISRILASLALACLFVAPEAFAANVSVSISVSPQSSPQPTAPTITWNSTGAASCVASDGWTGTKPAAGSETLPQVTKTTKFTLTCSSPTGPVTLEWTPPTKNTDGSTLTNLAAWQIMIGSSATSLSRGPVIQGAGVTSAIVESPPGLQWFSIRAVTSAVAPAAPLESDNSTPMSLNVIPDQAVGAVTLTVDVRPMPPTNFRVHQ